MNGTNENVEGLEIRIPEVPFRVKFTKSFIQANFFYVLSACFIMYGCYQLMETTEVFGKVFQKTLEALLILQGYELLVIVTAILIFKKLKVLSDAFTLLIIETVLLLDPTFFSNTFSTILYAKQIATPFNPVWVNAVCFALVPIKLYILIKMIRFPFTRRMWNAFLFTAAVIYIGNTPLNFVDANFSQYDYYYILGWMPLILSILLPSMSDMVKDNGNGYMSKEQQKWLPRLLLLITMGILLSHYVESSQVYIKRYLPLYMAPPIFALIFLIVKNNSKESFNEGKILFIDFLTVVAIIVSFRHISLKGKSFISGEILADPRITTSNIPLLVAGIAAIGIYLYCFYRTGIVSFLGRVIALAFCGLGWLVIKTGIIGMTFRVAAGTGENILHYLHSNSLVILLPLWALLVVIAWNFRNIHIWQIVTVYSIIMFFYLLPVKLIYWIPESIGCFFVMSIFFYHFFGDPRKEKFVAAFIVICFALGRYFYEASFWSVGIVVCECFVFIAAGYILKQKGYKIIGGLQGIVFIIYVSRNLPKIVQPSLLIIFGGLILFVLGILVTSKKKYFLDKIEKWSEEIKSRHKEELEMAILAEDAAVLQVKSDPKTYKKKEDF